MKKNYNNKEPISRKTLNYIYLKLREHSIQWYAPNQYNILIHAMNKYYAQFRRYFKIYAPILENQFLRYEGTDEYSPWFNDPTVRALQFEILLMQQDYRNAIDGKPLVDNDENPLKIKLLVRHHYKHDKADCRLIALVVITNSDYAMIEAKNNRKIWERRLEEAKIYLEAGKPPRYWEAKYRKDFIKARIKQFRELIFYYSYSLV